MSHKGFIKEKRVNRCECGSTIFYKEYMLGKWWVICAGVSCDRKWEAKRNTDPHLAILPK